MNTRKCAQYGRVSTLRQAMVEEGGLDTQFNLMDQLVKFETDKDAETEWLVVDRYREEGWSGKNLERPEFKRMMRDIESGKINTVIVYKIDRITRSLRDFYTLWEKFEKHGVQFVSLHEKFDTTSAVGRAMLKLILIFAELEREQTAERTSETMLHRAQQGLFNFQAPLGYEHDPDNKGVLKIVESQKETVIKHFFKKCVELGSASGVVKHLHDAGIKRPKYVTKKTNQPRGGGKYHKQAVINLLTSKVYLGKIEYKGEIYDGQHDAIVEESLFNRVQDIIDANRVGRSNCKAQGEHVYLLQSLVRCGKCGSMMTPVWSTGRSGARRFYYQCTRNSHTNGTECDARYLPAKPVEDFVVDQISEWAKDRKEIERAVKAASKYRDEAIGGINIELQDIRNQLLETKGSLSRLVSAVEGGADYRTFSERIDGLEAERTKLEGRIDRLEIERADREKETLSSEVVAETYCDFPFIVDKLKAQGKLHDLKEILANYIVAIDVHQEEDDPSSGHMNIMLFETEIPGWELAEHKKTLISSVLTTGNCERMSKLPRLDSNQ